MYVASSRQTAQIIGKHASCRAPADRVIFRKLYQTWLRSITFLGRNGGKNTASEYEIASGYSWTGARKALSSRRRDLYQVVISCVNLWSCWWSGELVITMSWTHVHEPNGTQHTPVFRYGTRSETATRLRDMRHSKLTAEGLGGSRQIVHVLSAVQHNGRRTARWIITSCCL